MSQDNIYQDNAHQDNTHQDEIDQDNVKIGYYNIFLELIENIIEYKTPSVINDIEDMNKAYAIINEILSKKGIRYKFYTDNYSAAYYNYDMLVLAPGNIWGMDIFCYVLTKIKNFKISIQEENYLKLEIKTLKNEISISSK